MESIQESYQIISSKFIGAENGLFTYELTFNQSMVHTGRFVGIEDGLNAYRENEIKEHEAKILKEAEEIKQRQSKA